MYKVKGEKTRQKYENLLINVLTFLRFRMLMEYSNKKDLIKILEVDHAYFDGINLKSFLMRVELFSLKKFNKSDPI